VSRHRDQEAALRAAHRRWFALLSREAQLAHLREFDGLPPRAHIDLTTHRGRIAAPAKRHRPRRGGGRR
jgi:hypothetical protein